MPSTWKHAWRDRSGTPERLHQLVNIGALIIRIGFLSRAPISVTTRGPIRATIRVWGVGALIFRIGFGGILYDNHNKEPKALF